MGVVALRTRRQLGWWGDFRFYSTRIGVSTGNFGLISLKKGKNIGKFVLRHSRRAEGLSGERSRVEQDRVATVEETGFQICVVRGGRRLPLFPLSRNQSRRGFSGRWKKELFTHTPLHKNFGTSDRHLNSPQVSRLEGNKGIS